MRQDTVLADRQVRAAELVAHGCITAESACRHKVAHATRNDARHAAKDLARAQNRRVDTYRCPFCSFWHLTKRSHGDDAD